MVCPYCKQKTQVTNSRGAKSQSIWRRRRCSACRAVFSTKEEYVYDTVIKVDSSDGLRALQQSEVLIMLYKAFAGDDTQLAAIEELSKTTLKNIVSAGNAIVGEQELKQHILDVLNRYNKEIALRYQLDSGLLNIQNKQS